MTDPATPAERTKAMRIRAKAKMKVPVSAEDAGWLAEYEQRMAVGRGDAGASARSSKKVSYTEEEEHAAAVGTGTAAEMAAGAAMVREEGRRIDSIVDRGINALQRAVECYEKMATQLLKERHEDSIVQRALVESVRNHYVALAEAEGDLVRQEAEHQAAIQDPDANPLETEALKMLMDRIAGKHTNVNTGGNGKR